VKLPDGYESVFPRPEDVRPTAAERAEAVAKRVKAMGIAIGRAAKDDRTAVAYQIKDFGWGDGWSDVELAAEVAAEVRQYGWEVRYLIGSKSWSVTPRDDEEAEPIETRWGAK
jgi:hypothetical protein